MIECILNYTVLILLDDLVSSIVGYFYKSCRILMSSDGESKYKRRVKKYAMILQLNCPMRDLLFNSDGK